MSNAKPQPQPLTPLKTAGVVKLPRETNRARQLRKRLHMIRILRACLKESPDA